MIDKQSLAEKVAASLQQQVALGHYKTGEKLPTEPELMKIFGVGRSTIREAIKLLANSGLLKVQQGLGTFVANSSGGSEPFDQRIRRAKSDDLNEVRSLLEIKIAEKAAVNRTIADIEKMKHFLQERKIAAANGSVGDCIQADVNFHIAIAEASNNEILAELYKAAAIHLKKWFLNLYTDTRAFQDTYNLHERLLKSIIDGDPRKAWDAASKILTQSNN